MFKNPVSGHKETPGLKHDAQKSIYNFVKDHKKLLPTVKGDLAAVRQVTESPDSFQGVKVCLGYLWTG